MIRKQFILESGSGALSVASISAAVVTRGERAAIFFNATTLTLPDVDDEIDFYFQTTYDGGVNWCDVENIHFANADDGTTAKRVVRFGSEPSYATTDTAVVCTDGTLADNTRVKLPLGDEVRVKVAITGATAPTFAYAAMGVFY